MHRTQRGNMLLRNGGTGRTRAVAKPAKALGTVTRMPAAAMRVSSPIPSSNY